jgi:hypothetical protein
MAAKNTLCLILMASSKFPKQYVHKLLDGMASCCEDRNRAEGGIEISLFGQVEVLCG